MPKVLISDKLSPAAVEIFRSARHRGGREAGPLPGRAARHHRRLRRAGDPLRHQGDARTAGRRDQPESGRPRRHRRGQRRCEVRHRARRGGDEHAARQHHHHRRACHRDDVRAGAANPRGIGLHQGRQVGKEPLHGRRAVRQDARPDRLRQYRLDRRRPRDRAEDASRRLRSLPVRKARARPRRRKGRTRRPARARRFHHAAHAADRSDAQHPLARGPRADASRRAHHQLRPRRPARRSGTGRRAEIRPRRRRRARRVRDRAGHVNSRCSGWKTSCARRISAPPRPRRRRTSRCRSPSR